MVDCKENFKFDPEVKGLNIVHAVQYSIEAFTTSGHKASVRDKLAQLDLKIQENATARIWTSKFPSVSPDLLSKRRPSNQTLLPWSPCFLNHSFVPNCIKPLLRCKLWWTSNPPGGVSYTCCHFMLQKAGYKIQPVVLVISCKGQLINHTFLKLFNLF